MIGELLGAENFHVRVAALQAVEVATPDNARLPFLNAQLVQLQLREYLDNARNAIRESRFEDAQDAITGAQALPVQDRSEINALEDDLREALSAQRVDEVLAQANARLEEGKLIAPSNDNARYYFELALSRDPDNTAARAGIVAIASKLVLQARAQIDAGNFEEAGAILVDARRVDPTSSELAATTAALANARDRREQEIRAAAERAAEQRAAEQRAAQQRAAEELAAEQRAAEQRAAEQRAAEFAAMVNSEGQPTVAEPVADTAASEPQPEPQQASQQPVQQPVVSEPAAETTAAVAGSGDAIESSRPVQQQTSQPVQQQATAPAPRDSSPVAASSLKRTKYVAPKYPRGAQRRGLSGWVDVLFTVDIDGSVTDITVRGSDPGDMFVTSATKAVEDWRFEPVIEDGVAIQKRAAVRMMFALED